MLLKDKNLYYVGGVVRDEILGINSFDTDYCYEGNAIEFAQGLNIIKTNSDFGTVRVRYLDNEIDIASTRIESYPKAGHLPVITKIGCSLKEDLRRRDFTINAMAKNTETNEIIDFYGGKQDIQNKILKVLHDNSFIDDPTRIVRGLKFSIRFGFKLEEHTKKLQENYLKNINYDLSYHRLKKELKETFNLNSDKAFNLFLQQGIYKLLGKEQQIPNILITNISNLISEFKINQPWVIYMGLFDLSNFELTKQELDIINSFNNIKKFIPQNNYELYVKFNELPIESLLMYCISINTEQGLKYLRDLKNIKPEITGNDLRNIGISEGKVYKQIFNELIKLKINNKNLSKKDEVEFAKNYIKNN